jgi:hypothetical protein
MGAAVWGLVRTTQMNERLTDEEAEGKPLDQAFGRGFEFALIKHNEKSGQVKILLFISCRKAKWPGRPRRTTLPKSSL